MAIFNNQDPQRESNVGQFGATDESIGAYKQAAEYAKDAEYWAKISQQGIENINDLLVVVQDLYEKGELQLEEIEQLKRDFAAQDARLIQLIAQTNGVITDANNTIDKMDDKLAEVQAQLDILLAMDVSVTTLPPGTDATGNYNPQTGLISLGIPEGQPGKDGTVTDLATAPMGVPDSADFGFYVESTDSKVYRAKMSDIAKTFPAVVSVSYNGGNQKEVGDVNITKAKLGLGNVLDVPSYSKTETDNLNLPYPDVWAPLNDDLRLLAGFAPYDKLLISGQVLELPTKSLTFSRATTATYIDKSGVLQTAAINEPRFEKEGLLIEGQSTNYYLNSNEPLKWNATGVSKAQLQDGITQAISGVFVTTADRTDFTILASDFLSVAAAGSVCISCRVKGESGRFRMRVANATSFITDCTLDLIDGKIAQGGGVLITDSSLDSDGYYNFACRFTAVTADDYSFQLRVSPRSGETTIPTGKEVRLQMPQLEPGIYSTSYIPTTGSAATRAADDCTLQRSGNDNYFGPVTITAEVHCNGKTLADGQTSSRRGILAIYPTTNDYCLVFVNSATNAAGVVTFSYGDPGQKANNEIIDDGNPHIVSVRSNGLQKDICIDGSLSGSGTVTKPAPGNVASYSNVIMIGRGAGSSTPGQRMLNGHIRNLRIWHRAFTDNQIRGVR